VFICHSCVLQKLTTSRYLHEIEERNKLLAAERRTWLSSISCGHGTCNISSECKEKVRWLYVDLKHK
jgi:hypothetical protein